MESRAELQDISGTIGETNGQERPSNDKEQFLILQDLVVILVPLNKL